MTGTDPHTPRSRARNRVSRVAALAVFAGAVALALTLGRAGVSELVEPAQAAPAAKKSVAQTVKKSIWGPVRLPNGEPVWDTYRELGIGLYSIQARWELIAPTKPADPTNPNDPAYQWPSYFTQFTEEALAAGMKVQIALMGVPPWANGGKSWKWAPNQVSDFADFATAVSRKYPTVDLYMIWGEPNRKANFGPFTPSNSVRGPLNKAQQQAPRKYAQILDAAYGALKADDPKNLVIGGNTYTSSGPQDINTYAWMRYMKLPGGKRPRMDMWGHNAWANRLPSLKGPPSPRGTVAFGDLRYLAEELDKTFPGKPKKLFLAEWGVPTGFLDEDLGYTLKTNEAKKWVRSAYKIVRTWKRIYTLGWIHPMDNERNSTGLLTETGERKPTFNVFKAG